MKVYTNGITNVFYDGTKYFYFSGVLEPDSGRIGIIMNVVDAKETEDNIHNGILTKIPEPLRSQRINSHEAFFDLPSDITHWRPLKKSKP